MDTRYGDAGHEEELLEWERREDEDERAGIFYGDPRRCKSHPEIVTSSPDGMFDGLCWKCEQAADGAFDEEPPADGEALKLEPAPAPLVGPFDDDDIPF